MAIVCAGAFVTSGFGVGGGVLVTPLFISVLPPKYGIGLLAPLMLLMSAAGVRQYWRLWDNRHILILLPASLAGIWLGTYLLAEVPPRVVRKTVGVLAVIFGVFQFLAIDRPEWRNRLRPTDGRGWGSVSPPGSPAPWPTPAGSSSPSTCFRTAGQRKRSWPRRFFSFSPAAS